MGERIQRSRAKGWRMPEGAVYVGRGSAYGNPWRVVQHARHVDTGQPLWAARHDWEINYPSFTTRFDAARRAVDEYRKAVTSASPTLKHPPDIAALRGKNLACWCPLDQPCHADVLLDLANRDA